MMNEPFGYFKCEIDGWVDCAETDEGAIALYEAPKWLPIESAPKDGTSVLVASTKCPNAFAVASWDGDEWRDMGDIGWAGMYGDDGNQPTHWQPLPPPQEKEQ